MMKLTFLGVGSAFTYDNGQSNMLLEENGIKFLLDCGGDARFTLKDIGLTAKDIDAVYISHCHADHIGGLEWLGFSRYFSNLANPSFSKPDLYINERLAGILWDDCLKGGMASHQGVVLTLDNFFKEVYRLKKNAVFEFPGTNKYALRTVQTVHYMDGYEIVPSYGLLIKSNVSNKEYFITTDTQFCPNQIMDFYKRADVIYQDAETAPFKSGVHAHYSELTTLPEAIKKKMWLYHYNDGKLPDAVADGFAGFIKKSQVFELE